MRRREDDIMLAGNNYSDENKDLLCPYATYFISAYLTYMYFPYILLHLSLPTTYAVGTLITPFYTGGNRLSKLAKATQAGFPTHTLKP